MDYDSEEAKRQRREHLRDDAYQLSENRHIDADHTHYCRYCQDEYDCNLLQCDLPPQTLCHNCYDLPEEEELLQYMI